MEELPVSIYNWGLFIPIPPHATPQKGSCSWVMHRSIRSSMSTPDMAVTIDDGLTCKAEHESFGALALLTTKILQNRYHPPLQLHQLALINSSPVALHIP